MLKLQWVNTLIFAAFFVTLIYAENAAASLYSCEDFENNDEIEEILKSYKNTSFLNFSYFKAGTSVEGKTIHGLTVMPAKSIDFDFLPKIRVIGAIHGNECLSASMVLTIIDAISGGVNSSDEFLEVSSKAVFVFVPLVNPDGHDDIPAQRYNKNGVDLNRNFSFAWSASGTINGNDPFSEPESKAIRDLSVDNNFVLGLSYHTNANYVNSPWNYIPFYPLDEELIAEIGNTYAAQTDYNVTFGWDWYQISGDVNDWSLGTNGTFDWTIELPSDVNLDFDIYKDGVAAFFLKAIPAVKGKVTDEETGYPLNAIITVEPEGTPVYTDGETGVYNRILINGSYDISAWADGYKPVTMKNITASSDNIMRLDFKLKRSIKYTGKYRGALKVSELVLDRDITNSYFASYGYDNTTQYQDALGPVDGKYYSIGFGGEITLVMGKEIVDIEGDDFAVVSGTNSKDPAVVFVSQSIDGPFYEINYGTGDIYCDISKTPLESVKYIKIIDDGQTTFGEKDGGYDLDGIKPLTDNENDTETSVYDTEPDTETASLKPDSPFATVIGGCSFTEDKKKKSILTLLF
ncbi:MAG: hypothetical protein JXR91_11040 [Deltaproteobacteria bacterium]|nr:hypothetical protein [Deltaproteobacteria bacterium]